MRKLKSYEIFLRGYETASHKLPAYSITEAKKIFKELEGYSRMPYGTYFRENYRCPLSDDRRLDKYNRFVLAIKDKS